MAPSTSISSSLGARGSQGSLTYPRQSLSEILNLDPSCQNFTCIGYASSNRNNRCRRQIRAMDRDLAKVLLTTGDDDIESGEELEQLLARIAPRVLCLGYHQDQAPTIVAEWSGLIADYKGNSQNSPASSERASAIRALPSARNNLSRYANAEPVISPLEAVARHPQREDKEPRPHDNNSSRLSRSNLPGERLVQSPEPVPNPYSGILETSSSTHSGSPSRPGNIERNQLTHYLLTSSAEFPIPSGTATQRVGTADRERNSSQVSQRMPYLIRSSSGSLPSLPAFVSTSPRTSTRPARRVETSRTRSTSSRARTSGSPRGEQSRPTTTSSSTTRTGTSAPRQPSAQEVFNSRPPVIPAPPSISPIPDIYPSIAAANYTPASTTPSAYSPYYLAPFVPEPSAIRRPTAGDCSICYEPLATAPLSWNGETHKKSFFPRHNRHKDMDKDKHKGQLVWCQAECGVNFHENCFDRWKDCCRPNRVSCPNCRAPWIS